MGPIGLKKRFILIHAHQHKHLISFGIRNHEAIACFSDQIHETTKGWIHKKTLFIGILADKTELSRKNRRARLVRHERRKWSGTTDWHRYVAPTQDWCECEVVCEADETGDDG